MSARMQQETNSTPELDQLCINTIRALTIDAVQKAKSGHPGLPLGAAPMAYALWTKFMRYNPRNPKWENRDRFLLSAGHGCMLLYSLLYLTGYDLSLDEKRNARVGKLSGGQKQRLAAACALVGNPDILFLDEPTTGLDPQSRLQLWEVVARFRATGGTVLLTTHYMEEAERLCDRIAIVDHGHLIALGTPAELIASLGAQQVVELATQAPLAAEDLAGLPGVRSARRNADGVALTVAELHVSLPLILAKAEPLGLTRLSTHHATLEDVFVHLTGRHLRE